MNLQRVLIVFTVVNLGLLIFLLVHIRTVEAQAVTPVLRGRAFEIIDEAGKVRASIHVEPAGRMPNGEKYPQTVLLRLIDPNGQPSVKLGTSEQGGAGLSLVGGDDVSYAMFEGGWNGEFLEIDQEGRAAAANQAVGSAGVQGLRMVDKRQLLVRLDKAWRAFQKSYAGLSEAPERSEKRTAHS